MPRLAFAEAGTEAVEHLALALVAARVFADADEVRRVHAESPWRIQVAGRDVAVVDRWRDHLDVLSIDALWCAQRDVPAAVRQLRTVGERLGLPALVTQPVPAGEAHVYEAVGMRVCERISTWSREIGRPRIPRRADARPFRIRPGSLEDLDTVLTVDAECFDPFWRYDRRHLERFCRLQRLGVAEVGTSVIGYTLTTADRGNAQLGRLCVVDQWRRRGVARALVADAERYAREQQAARVVLCTQVDNAPSRALYRALGFRESADRVVLLRSD